MSRFITTAICIVLIVAVLPLADISQGGKPVYAAQIGIKPQSPDVVYQSDTSPYEGTYRGTFSYEYREWKNNPDYPKGERYVWSQGVPASLTLTVTFKTHEPNILNMTAEELARGGTWSLDITNAIVDDKRFGTGSNGVTPINIAQNRSEASLPYDAKSAGSLMDTNKYININFPNGANLRTTGVKVGFAEWTLSGDSWTAFVPTKEGPFSEETLPDGGPTRYGKYPKSWSLNKVPSSTITTTDAAMKETRTKLDTAVKAGDIKGIMDALNIVMSGLFPEPEATQLREKCISELANINQSRLDAAIAAKDVNVIIEAMKFAMSGVIPAQEKAQTKQAEEALARLLGGWPPVTSSDKSRGGAVLTGKSGEVEVRKGPAGEWTKDDRAVLTSGDQVRTGENSQVKMENADGYEITLGPKTSVDIVDLDKSITLLLGKIKIWVKKFGTRFEVRTPPYAMAVRGTEFTVDVAADGTTTVMVLEGAVSVQDITSNRSIMLMWGQSVTLPSTPAGLTQEEMLGRVKAALPETINRWWEKDPAATGSQSAVQNSALRGDGSFAIGKFEILGRGSRLTPEGFIFGFLVVAEIFFLVVGRVYAFRLRRMSKKN